MWSEDCDLISAMEAVEKRLSIPRIKAEKTAKLKALGRAHLAARQVSALNQREHCERHDLPPKRFGNCWAKLSGVAPVHPAKLLWRRGGGLNHMIMSYD